MSHVLLANRFRVLAELGHGAMGAVYRVADTLQGDRELALKRIQVPGTITPTLLLQFKEEFRAMARLKHPNTVEVFDYGQLDEQNRFIAMELVPGVELAERIRAERLPFEEIYGLLIQLLRALGFIHSRLYVHRDIKSQNIRVTPDGTLKLIDFGLMAQLGTPIGGSVSGTPGYLPPESVRGGVLTAASDLYSVGCLAFELITGRLPFEGKVMEVIRAHVASPVPPMTALRAGVPTRLEAIVMKLLAKDPAARYQHASEVIDDLAALAGLQVVRESLEQRKSYLVTSAVVGREREIAALDQALAEAKAGRNGAIFLGAPAGVGKSRLAHELALHAKLEEFTVLRGGCAEHGGAPYAALSEALRPLAGEAALAPLFTEGRPLGGAPSEAHAKLALQAAIVQALHAAAAQAPVLLVVEDLHWADPQTLEVLNQVIRESAGQRLMCLATLRSDESPASSAIWYTVEEQATRYMSLDPLDAAQSIALVRAMLGPVRSDAMIETALFRATGGNPFYITELLRDLMEREVLTFHDGAWGVPDDVSRLGLPASMSEAIARRLARLSEAAVRVARIAAVLGQHAEREALNAIAGLDEDAFFAALEELVERQFLVREGDRYGFPHARVRETLYAGIPDDLRRTLHLRCGERLEALAGDRPETVVHELAHHFGLGEGGRKAYDYVRLAGDQARSRGMVGSALEAWLEADRLLETLAHPDRAQEQADLWYRIGATGFESRPAMAIEALEKLVRALRTQQTIDEALQATDRLPRLVEAYAFLAAAYGFDGKPMRGLALAGRALQLMPQAGPLMRAALDVVKGPSLLSAGRYDELSAIAREGASQLAMADLSGQSPLVQATRVATISYQMGVCYQGVRPDDAHREDAMAAAERAGAFSLLNTVPHYHAIWHAWGGRPEEVVRYIEATTQNCRRIGAPLHPWVLYLRPYLLYLRGEPEEALALVAHGLQAPQLDHTPITRALLVVLEGQLQLLLARYALAEAAFAGTERHAREHQLYVVLLQALLGLGDCALARGDHDAAHAHWIEAYEMATVGVARNPLHQAIALRKLAAIAVARKDFALARSQLARAKAIVERPEQANQLEQAHLQCALGDVQQAAGEREAAAEAFRAAGERYHRLKNRYWLHAVTQRLEALMQLPKPPAEDVRGAEARWLQMRALGF